MEGQHGREAADLASYFRAKYGPVIAASAAQDLKRALQQALSSLPTVTSHAGPIQGLLVDLNEAILTKFS